MGSPKKCSKCDKKSVPGLKPGYALCQYHFTELMWGKAWADKCEQERDRQAKAGAETTNATT